MTFSPDHLFSRLPAPPSVEGYHVGFSGGLDSTVLLHAMTALRDRLAVSIAAVHVHHGLHPAADGWSEHCRRIAARLEVPLQIIRVDAKPRKSESPEAAARRARYRAFESVLQAGECLLTAHQQDDQAETLLLQLLRGAGPAGLASMPIHTCFGRGWLGRPLLDISRAELHSYANGQGYVWVEDMSNRDTALDRNYLRHEVLPRLSRRWPGAGVVLAAAADLQAEAAELLYATGREDVEKAAGHRPGTLSVRALNRLTDSRKRNALRAWIKLHILPLPPRRKLMQVAREVLTARADAMPCVRWPGAEIRRCRDDLYAMPPLIRHDPGQLLTWDLRENLCIPQLDITLAADEYRQLKSQTVSVRFRTGGERCRPPGRHHHHDLKKLFQEAGVPPWERDRIPLIYVEDKLAAVAGYWRCC